MYFLETCEKKSASNFTYYNNELVLSNFSKQATLSWQKKEWSTFFFFSLLFVIETSTVPSEQAKWSKIYQIVSLVLREYGFKTQYKMNLLNPQKNWSVGLSVRSFSFQHQGNYIEIPTPAFSYEILHPKWDYVQKHKCDGVVSMWSWELTSW